MEMNVVIDDRQVQAALARAMVIMGNLKPLMNDLGQRYERRVLDNFRAQRSPAGTPWLPMSDITMVVGLLRNKGFKKNGDLTAKGKQRLANKRLLFDSGDLLRSIHYQADRDSVTIGSDGSIPYNAIHQFGGQAGRNKKVRIPARPYLAENQGDHLVLAEQDRQMILARTAEFVMQAWR